MKQTSTLKRLFFFAAATTIASTLNAQLYMNGPFINSPGTGPSGTDESWLFDASLSMGNFGYGASKATFYRVSDDFVVPVGQTWTIDSVYLYCYQTNAPTTASPITSVNIRIWNDASGTPGTTLIWGDTTTNRLARSMWTNSYRVLESATGTSNARAIFKNTANTPALTLPAGTYWIDYQFGGNTSLSGPWANPIVITGNATTGNGMQAASATAAWAQALDPGTNTQQGFPFEMYGTSVTGITENALVNNVSVFPNPANDFIQVNVNRQSGNTVKIEMYNTVGELVYSTQEAGQATFTRQIDCSKLAEGVYFLKVQAGNETVTKKFTKI